MSYARWSEESDVYVFLSVDRRFECCACELGEYHADTAAIVAHLEAHLAAGHQVPDRTIPSLRRDQSINDAWIASGDDEAHYAAFQQEYSAELAAAELRRRS